MYPKWTFRSDFVKLGSEIVYLFWQKNSRLFCLVFLQYFVRFLLYHRPCPNTAVFLPVLKTAVLGGGGGGVVDLSTVLKSLPELMALSNTKLTPMSGNLDTVAGLLDSLDSTLRKIE